MESPQTLYLRTGVFDTLYIGSGIWILNGRTLTTYVSGEVNITYGNIVLSDGEMSGTMSDGSLSMKFKAKKQ